MALPFNFTYQVSRESVYVPDAEPTLKPDEELNAEINVIVWNLLPVKP